jgi:hypothetical protein
MGGETAAGLREGWTATLSWRRTARRRLDRACARPPAGCGRWLGAARRERETRRVPVPSELIDAVRHAAERPDQVGDRFWDHVRERIERLITDQVPDGADGVRAILDEDRNEVVVSYRPT